LPLKPGQDVGTSIRELRSGKTYRHTQKKFGRKRAQRQAIAIALKNKRAGKKRARKSAAKR
jgi:hypothetical protein